MIDDTNYKSTEILVKADTKPHVHVQNTSSFAKRSFATQKGFWIRYFGPVREGSLRGSTIAMASITFGSGCLSFPYAVNQAGPVLALLIFIFICIISYFTLEIIMFRGLEDEVYDYNELVDKYTGSKWVTISNVNNLILCLGVIIGYQYNISRFAIETMEAFNLIDKNAPEDELKLIKLIQMSACMIFIQLPLSMLKDVSKLQYASIVGSFALIFTIVVVCVEMPFYLTNYLKENSVIWFREIGLNTIDCFAIFVFGFCAHNGVLQIYSELKRRTNERAYKVLNRSFTLEVILYVAIAAGGYFSLFDKCPDIILRRDDLPGFKDYYILVAKITLIICLHCVMAINYNIMRLSINSMFFNNQTPSFKVDLIMTIVIFLITNTITFFVKNATDVLNIFGGISSTQICFITPILIYVYSNGLPKTHYKNILSFILLGFMIIMGVTCTTKGVFDFIDKLNKKEENL